VEALGYYLYFKTVAKLLKTVVSVWIIEKNSVLSMYIKINSIHVPFREKILIKTFHFSRLIGLILIFMTPLIMVEKLKHAISPLVIYNLLFCL